MSNFNQDEVNFSVQKMPVLQVIKTLSVASLGLYPMGSLVKAAEASLWMMFSVSEMRQA